MMHPKAIMVDQIITYKKQAADLKEAGDPDSARLYEKLAASMEVEITGQPQAPAKTAAPQTTVPNEVLPGGAVDTLEGLGRV